MFFGIIKNNKRGKVFYDMENKTLAFDIDGTIIGKDGKIDSKVMALFNKADLNHTTFIFLTGGTSLSALKTLKLINDNLNNPTGKTIKAYYAADCGSKIVSPEGSVIKNETLSTDEVDNIIKAVRDTDKGSAVIYAARNCYFIEKQEQLRKASLRYIKNALLLFLYKRSENKKGNMGITINTCDYIKSKSDIERFIADNGKISSIFIAPTSGDKNIKKQVVSAVKAAAGKHPLYDGTLACVAADSKLNALKTILEIEKSNPNSTCVENVEEVVYFGDGTNDIELLEACNLSIARGAKLKDRVAKAATMQLDDCTEFASDLYSGEYDNVIEGNQRSL